ncbi:class I SAM-dependent methyltransferase [Sporobacter termitidis]|nr:methyltransferase domain-containing protein [Sporobacter termitidis]
MPHEAHKFDVAKRKKLDDPERVRLLTPRQTLLELGYREGASFADIGCGTGLFTIPAAEISGAGRIYAVDVSPEMLREVSEKSSARGLNNIETVHSSGYDFRLADLTADFILICAVLHEIDDKPRFLGEALRICGQGGKIAVIEFNESDAGCGPPPDMRLPAGQVKELLKGVGFTGIEETPVGAAFYAVTGVR